MSGLDNVLLFKFITKDFQARSDLQRILCPSLSTYGLSMFVCMYVCYLTLRQTSILGALVCLLVCCTVSPDRIYCQHVLSINRVGSLWPLACLRPLPTIYPMPPNPPPHPTPSVPAKNYQIIVSSIVLFHDNKKSQTSRSYLWLYLLLIRLCL